MTLLDLPEHCPVCGNEITIDKSDKLFMRFSCNNNLISDWGCFRGSLGIYTIVVFRGCFISFGFVDNITILYNGYDRIDIPYIIDMSMDYKDITPKYIERLLAMKAFF